MKKVILFLMFLMLSGGVLAIEAPVSVKTQPGDWVKIYARSTDSPTVLGLGNGTADDDGIFSYTFFSLNIPDIKFTVFVIRGREKIRDVDFSGHNVSEPLNIDCSGVGCKVVEEIVENEIVEEEIVENEAVVEDEKFSLSGKAVFSKEDGSINWGYSIGGFVVLLCLIIFIFGVLHRGKRKNVDVLDDDEKELQCMEKKVRETADRIKSVKDGKERKVKIENAKRKLVKEEAELKELQGGEDGRVEKAEDD